MIYRFDDCVLDTNLYTLQRGGHTLRLRLKVFRMCLYLLEHRDRVVSREELCTQVWPGQFVTQTTLEGVIRLVRQAVGDSGRTQRIIQTLHGHGYRFVAPVEESFLAEPADGTAWTVALANPVGVAVLPESPNIPTEIEDAREQVATLAAGMQEGTQHHSSAMNEPGTDTREVAFFTERWGGEAPGGWGWWMLRLGLGLALISFFVFGLWAVSWAVRAEGTVTPDKSRIAVLPFIDLSAEADQPYVADGLTENLIAELARIDGLTVIARTSVMKYKGSLKDVATIGRELRVGTIVEGSIRRNGNQVRINAQLINVSSQGYLWSQEYERELTEIFRIKSDIAIRVAHSLKVQVSAGPTNAQSYADASPGPVAQRFLKGQ